MMPSRDDEIEECYAREYDAERADRFLDAGGQTYHWADAAWHPDMTPTGASKNTPPPLRNPPQGA